MTMTAVTPGSAELLAPPIRNYLLRELGKLTNYIDNACNGAGPSAEHARTIAQGRLDQINFMLDDPTLRLAAKPAEEGMREALRPFADIAKFVTETQRNTRPIIFGMDNVILQRLTIGHLRAARAALYPPRES